MAGSKTEFTKMASATEKAIPPAAGNVLGWLAGLKGARELEFLLATMYSQVVWGKQGNGAWALSNGETTLPAESLLELRAFGPAAEVFVWREAGGLRGRVRQDEAGDTQVDTFTEEQLLWGTVLDAGKAPAGFTALRDGDQGLRHAPPLELDESYFITDEKDKRFGHRPVRLVLRHYVAMDDDTGLARVVDTRLVDVKRQKPPAKPQEAIQDEPES